MPPLPPLQLGNFYSRPSSPSGQRYEKDASIVLVGQKGGEFIVMKFLMHSLPRLIHLFIYSGQVNNWVDGSKGFTLGFR